MRFLGMMLFSIIAAVLFVLFSAWTPALGFSDNFSVIFSSYNLRLIWPQLIIAWLAIFFLLLGARLAFGARRKSAK